MREIREILITVFEGGNRFPIKDRDHENAREFKGLYRWVEAGVAWFLVSPHAYLAGPTQHERAPPCSRGVKIGLAG